MLTMPVGLSKNAEIWFRKEPTSREPKKVVLTCRSDNSQLGPLWAVRPCAIGRNMQMAAVEAEEDRLF